MARLFPPISGPKRASSVSRPRTLTFQLNLSAGSGGSQSTDVSSRQEYGPFERMAVCRGVVDGFICGSEPKHGHRFVRPHVRAVGGVYPMRPTNEEDVMTDLPTRWEA
jgi:hypothetical protein